MPDDRHHRHSIRLRGYDYSLPGAYFVTLVTWHREPLFGEVAAGEIRLNSLGKIARAEWFNTTELRPYVKLFKDEFVVMPNHVHGILWLDDPSEDDNRGGAAPLRPHSPAVAPKSLGAIVRAYKSAVTYAVNDLRGRRGALVWQRNYYEHIIRDEGEHRRIRAYILANPLNLEKDRESILEESPWSDFSDPE